MDSRVPVFNRINRCVRTMLVCLLVTSLAFTQVPFAHAEEASVPDVQKTEETPESGVKSQGGAVALESETSPAEDASVQGTVEQPVYVLNGMVSGSAAERMPEKGEAAETSEPVDEPREDCIPGEVVIVLDDAGPSAARAFDDEEALPFGDLDVDVVEELARATDSSGTVVSAKTPMGKTVDETIAALSDVPGIAFVQPNYIYRLVDGNEDDVSGGADAASLSAEGEAASNSVNDPLCSNSTANGGNQYYLYQSKVVDAWNSAQSGGSATVAVLDTGCRLDHEDLQGTIDVDHAYDTFNDVALSTLSEMGVVPNGDAMGHGTHVSGIVGAQTGNDIGMAGASYNAKVLPIKVFNNEKTSSAATASTADIVEAYSYLSGLVDDGSLSDLRVVNLSLGFYSTGTDTAFQQAIAKMRSHYGVLTVCAGGDGNRDGTPRTDRLLPSDFEDCLAVTSLDRDGGNTVWSDYNQYKDISAPGTSVTSASHASANGYAVKSGTSMAAPLVSGIVALVWAANPNLTVDEVVATLEDTADPVEDADNDRSGASGSHGAVNAKAAVESVLPERDGELVSETGVQTAVQEASAYNMVLVVRFAGDTTGDGKTGLNADFRYSGAAETETEWDYLRAEFNGNAYVKYSLRDYLNAISGGKHNQVNLFPQTNADGRTVRYITLPNDYDYYYGGASFGGSDNKLVSDVVKIFNEQYPSFDASRYDAIKDGYLDNLLIIPTVAKAAVPNDPLWPHKSNVGPWGLRLGKDGASIGVGAYNMVDSRHLDMGTLAHEYLHTLGARDYYRQVVAGDPVGVWDVMGAADTPRSWPLAITRQTAGWTTVPERSQSGTYTLFAPGSDKEQAFMFKSPLNDREYFVVEYRKQGDKYDMTALDGRIGGSGLIVYRVNPAYADVGNIRGQDYIYVFRPGETGLSDAYGGGDGLPNLVNAQVSTSAYATTLSRTSIGTADFSADITQGALCYSDGRNSGIVITPTAQSDGSITFTLAYPDYSQADLWDAVANADGSNATFGSNVDGVQIAADGNDLYALVRSGNAYQVMKHDGSNWTNVGGEIGWGLDRGQIAVRGGAVYFAAASYGSSRYVTLEKLVGSSWANVGRIPTSGIDAYANYPSLGFVGDDLYVIADANNKSVKLYRLDGSELKVASPELPIGSITHPRIFALNGRPSVACGDSDASKSYVFSLSESGAWETRSTLTDGHANVNSIACDSDTTYVYQCLSAGTDMRPKLLMFGADGVLEKGIDLPKLSSNMTEGSLVAANGRLYLTLPSDQSDAASVRTFTARASDPATWTQLGNDVYSSSGFDPSLSSTLARGRVCVGAKSTSGQAVVRSHALVNDVSDTHKAVFMADGIKIGEVEFAEGDTALTGVPSVPAKKGYSGRWADYTLGASDLIVEAEYAPNRYKITFVNWDGTPLLSGTYAYDSRVDAPVAARPSSSGTGYIFTGWSPAFSGRCDQAQDMTYKAQYSESSKKKHVVTFEADGRQVDRVEFFEGDTVLSRIPAVPQKTGYSGEWPSYKLGTSDLTVAARYTANSYTVTFKDWKGDALSSGRYAYGSAVTAPNVAPRPNSGGKVYAFVGWSPAFRPTCDGDATYVAQYSEKAIEHTVTFVADGKTVGTAKFNEVDRKLIGAEPAVPAKTGYTGSWAPYALGTQDITVSASYSANKYAMTFRNWDGTILQTGTYAYRSLVKAPLASRPSSSGKAYTFTGWSPAFSNVCDQAKNMVYTAQYDVRSIVHNAVFKADGAVVDAVPFSEGDAALSRIPAVPAKTGYTGSWAPYTLGNGDIVVEARYALMPNALTLQTNAHVQNKGWIGYRGNGAVVGTTGSSLRMESIRVRLGGALSSSDAISVQAHVQNIGWMSGLGNDKIAGTTGRSLRIEAMKLTLSPRLTLLGYHVYYRVHAQSVGWMGWAHDGAPAGTAGNGLRLEAIQIMLVAPGDVAPSDTYGGVRSAEGHPYIDSRDMNATLSSALKYDGMVHVQNVGDVSIATNGAKTLGTTGRGLRLEGLKLACPTPGVDVTYRTHVQNIGWQDWVGEGSLSGTQGRALRLEALQIKLTGAAAGSYDVYYRTHVQNIGWTGWARNGQQCGSAGYAYRMEAVQVMIVPKDGAAPGLCEGAFYRR